MRNQLSAQSTGREPMNLSDFRTFWTNDAEVNQMAFKNNVITTSKYTKANFLPKNLAKQFSNLANVYFLVMMILQVSSEFIVYSSFQESRLRMGSPRSSCPCFSSFRSRP